MTQLFITLGLIVFIVATHILVNKWAQYFHDKHGDDPKKTRQGILLITLPLIALFLLAAFVLVQTSP